MSENKHTPEPWISDGAFVGIPNGNGTFYMVPISGISEDKKKANARRIVACVNACTGSPTEALEEMQIRGLTFGQLAFLHIKFTQQRDELLAALEKIRDGAKSQTAFSGMSWTQAEKIAAAAIDSAKGAAS